MPKLSMPGALLVGDAGGMVDTVALKGVHHCIKSGMLAAEAIYASLKAGEPLESYEQAVEESSIGKELYQVRNTRQPFSEGLHRRRARWSGLAIVDEGQAPARAAAVAPQRQQPMFIGDTRERYPKPDGKYTFDKLSSVYISGNATRDDAPEPHPGAQERPARDRRDVASGCAPPGVYEIPDDAPESGPVDVIVNYTNCVQCGAITAKGGRLTPPEGGDGPLYTLT